MNILGELLVKLGIRGHDDVERGLDKTKGKIHETGKEAKSAGEHMKSLGGSMLSVAGNAIKAAGALGLVGAAAATAGGAAIAVQAFDNAVSLDGIVRGLATVNENADTLGAQLKRLKELAKLPGLGFEEAAQGALRLQAVGLSAGLAERAMKSVGNALGSVGAGKSELDGVLVAMQQIVSKGSVQAEEINQIAERMPQIRAAMKAAFGTADTEVIQKMGLSSQQFLEGIIGQLEKLPEATGSAKNAIENLGDGIKFALLPLGQGLVEMFVGASDSMDRLLKKVETKATQIGEVLSALGKSGAVGDILSKALGPVGDLLGGDSRDGVLKMISVIGSVVANLPGAVAYAASYVMALFDAVGHNIAAAFDYAQKRTENLVKMVSEVAQGVGKFLGSIAQLLAPAIKFAVLTAMDALAEILPRENPVAPPVWKQVRGPDFKKFDLLQDAKSIYDKTAPFVKPLQQVPDGLGYGGAAKEDATKAALKQIQQNTFDTARATRSMEDTFSLRRQALGGGEMGSVGATPAEIYGGAASVPLGSSGFGTEFARAIERVIDERAERKANAILSRFNGGGFRPR